VLFLVQRFLSPWWRRRQVPPKRRFLQEPHDGTSQKRPFFNNSNAQCISCVLEDIISASGNLISKSRTACEWRYRNEEGMPYVKFLKESQSHHDLMDSQEIMSVHPLTCPLHRPIFIHKGKKRRNVHSKTAPLLPSTWSVTAALTHISELWNYGAHMVHCLKLLNMTSQRI
jgi:hypothetical protein